MRDVSLWRCLLGVENTVIERVEFDEEAEVLVAHVRPVKRERSRCGRCRRPCPGYDSGPGRRRWRALDLGAVTAMLESDSPRVRCRAHGVVVAAVPWARHDAGHTRAFDDQVAWLATQTSKSTLSELMRIAWRTVGSIITRVWADIEARHDRLAELRRIGIDEISYKKGHKYLMVVVDHDTRRLVWAAPGRDSATVREFFDLLGEDRCAQITHVSADGADFIDTIVEARCPGAVRVADPFHIVQWATEALDEVRRSAWNDARAIARQEPKRGRGRPRGDAPPRPGNERAKALKGARYSLWKNPENLTENQQVKLAWIAATDPRLYRAYLLKEGLRLIFTMPYDAALEALDRWIAWARRCRIPAFVTAPEEHRQTPSPDPRRDRAQPVQRPRSNRPTPRSACITRIAFGFKSPKPSSPSRCSASAATDPTSRAGTDPQVCQESPFLRHVGVQEPSGDARQCLPDLRRRRVRGR